MYIYVCVCVFVYICICVRWLLALRVLYDPVLPVSLSGHRRLNRYPHQTVWRGGWLDNQQDEKQILSEDGRNFLLNNHLAHFAGT